MRCSLLSVVCVALFAVAANAILSMPAIFSDNMVLQRAPDSARIWGFSTMDGVSVTVTIAGQVQTTTSSDGWWSVLLDPVEGGAPFNLTVAGGATKIEFANVAFGDVYICSGQSNMQMTVNLAFDAQNNMENSAYPNLRWFTVAENISYTPLYDLASGAPYQWGVSSPNTINGSAWAYFSATCYYFGRNIHILNTSLPIGLIDSDWGGTYVQAWSSPDALAACPQSDMDLVVQPKGDALAYTPEKFVRGVDVGDNPNQPSVLWNAMIHPLLNMTVKGAVWYQGEANAGDPTGYSCMFPAMISDWRVKFNTSLPFFFVQLAAYPDGGGAYPAIRQAQTTALFLPLVGMATAIDLGDPFSPQGSIHPRNKSEVGRRLALVAQNVIYGQYVVSGGPAPGALSLVQGGSPITWVVTIFFQSAGPVMLGGTQFCKACCSQDNDPFVIVTSKGGQVVAQSVAVGTAVAIYVTLPDGSYPVRVQHAWYDYPQCVVFDSYSTLPAAPFDLKLQ